MGTLTVQTLQAPTSGANANKVLIPSGHTLDASAGTILPSANQIVQHLSSKPTAVTNINSGSYMDAAGFSVTITPKYTNSKILIRVWAKASHTNGGGNAGNSAQDYRLLRDSTQLFTAQYQNYFNQTSMQDDFYPPFTFSYIDTPSSTSSITYKIQGRLYAGNQRSWAINHSNGGSEDAVMEVLEIKQ